MEWVKITFRNWVRVLESQIRKYVKPRIEFCAHRKDQQRENSRCWMWISAYPFHHG